jgi:hypothetical protein
MQQVELFLRRHFFRCATDSIKKSKTPGANPTIASHNAGAVNFYNATGCLARFENRNVFF